MPIYRPRWHAELLVPVMGSTADRKAQEASNDVVRVPLRVCSWDLEANDHNHADVLKVTADWNDAGVDPRLLGNASISFWLGEANDDGEWTPTHDDLSFLGIARSVRRRASGDEKIVEIEALDFTTLFLEAKPFPPDGVPHYDMTLDQAWALICDHTGGKDAVTGDWFSSVQVLRDRIELRGLSSFPRLGGAVSKRFAKLSRVPCKPQSDAWAVWQQCVGMMGLISFIDRDRVVVSTALDYYTRDNPPRFVWGRNVAELSEDRDAAIAGKKIGVTSFDPITGTTLEAFYPSKSDQPTKKVGAHGANGGGGASGHVDDYEMFEYEGVTDPEILLGIARRIFEERARQELQGTIRTVEMRVDTPSGEKMDVLSLRAGDSVAVEWGLSREDLDVLAYFPTLGERIAYLVRRGYQPAVAELLAKNVHRFDDFDQTFHVKRVSAHSDVNKDGGKFEVEISYCNRIRIDGSTEGP